MKFLMSCLMLSVIFVTGITFLAMAYHGIRTGKVYYESSSSPILFRNNPIRFILWCTLLIVTGIGCMVFFVKIFREQ